MQHVFRITSGFMVPDETIVYPFLNSKDAKSRIPWDISNLTSLAIGLIAPFTSSRIHVHPIVTLITWVIQGQLTIKMKDKDNPKPYELEIGPEQAALIAPGTIIQHINSTDMICRAIYIVSPAYVYLPTSDATTGYDDAIILYRDWDTLAKQDWALPELADLASIEISRASAITRLQEMKRE
jgi:hypothetical protein